MMNQETAPSTKNGSVDFILNKIDEVVAYDGDTVGTFEMCEAGDLLLLYA